MKAKLKAIAVVLLLIFIAIQFYQPALNIDKKQRYETDFSKSGQVPKAIGNLLKTSCYDCHSNNTNYVWYDYIQPARAFVDSHIKDAKADLNFNEWSTYSNRKQERLLASIKKQIETKKMPLPSYTLMHKSAKLNNEQIKMLSDWLSQQN